MRAYVTVQRSANRSPDAVTRRTRGSRRRESAALPILIPARISRLQRHSASGRIAASPDANGGPSRSSRVRSGMGSVRLGLVSGPEQVEALGVMQVSHGQDPGQRQRGPSLPAAGRGGGRTRSAPSDNGAALRLDVSAESGQRPSAVSRLDRCTLPTKMYAEILILEIDYGS